MKTSSFNITYNAFFFLMLDLAHPIKHSDHILSVVTYIKTF